MSTDKAARPERWNLHHERTRMYTERIDVRNEDCDTLFSLGPDDTAEIEDGAIAEVCSNELIARARLIVASVNHCESLAEALRELIAAQPTYPAGRYCEPRYLALAKESLASYDASTKEGAS